MTYPNIGICGLLRSGKDTVAEYLTQNYGYTQVAFGDALKDDFHRRFPEIPRDPKPRLGYQSHGQFMRKQFGSDIWVRKCFAKIDAIAAENMYADLPFRVVVSDLRQPNEYEALKSAGCVIIRVTAPEALRIDRAIKSADTFNLRDLSHETESYVNTFSVDYEIVNDGTLAELYAKVDEVMWKVTQ